jgi:hypothetical protein
MASNTSTQKLVNELESAVESSKELLKITDKTDDLFKDMAKTVKDSFSIIDKKTTKGLIAFNKALSVTNKILEKQEENNEKKIKQNNDLSKQEKELIQLKKKLAKGLTDEVIENEKLRIQIQEQTKQRKIQAKQSLRLLDTYQLESARLNKLRKEYKNLAAQNKSNTKEAKKLLKSITELDDKLKEIDDTVGQNQRSVGKYEDAMKKLNSTLSKAGIAAVLIKGFELLTNSFGDSRDGALLLEQSMNKVSAVTTVIVGRLTTASVSIRKLFDDAKGGFAKFEAFGSAIGILVGAFDNMGSQIEETTKNLNSITELTQRYDIEIQALERSISKLNKSQILQTQIAENDTLSFQIRANASKEAVKQATKLGKNQEDLARKQLDLQSKIIATQLIAKGVSVDENASAEELIKTLNKKDNARKISADVERAFTDAFVSNQDAQLESSERLSDTLEKQNILYNDRAQAILDIQVDGLDNQKTINERIVANDKETFDRRKETLDRTKILFEDGYEAQKETLIALQDQIIASERVRINSSSILTKAQKKQQLAELERQQSVLTGAKIDEIIAEDDANIQAQKIIDLELNEKTIIDLLAVLRDYRTGQQDLKETEDAYNDTLKDKSELQSEIISQQKVLNGDVSIKTFEETQLDRDIEAATKRRDLTKENTLERLKAQKELNDLLIAKQKKADDKRLEARKKLIEDGITIIDNVLSKAREKQNREVDAEIDAIDSRLDSVRDAINNGNSEASQSLAELEKQKLLAEKKKEALRKAEIRDQKIIAGLQLLSANANDPNAVGKTLGDVSLLIAGLDSIKGFIDGTENVANSMQGHKVHNGEDGYIAKFDGREGILNPEQNAKRGNLSNDDLVELGAMHNAGTLSGGTTVLAQNNKELVKEVKEIVKAVKSIPIQSYNYDDKSKHHKQVIESNNKTEIIKVRVNNVYK